jgi:site-specific recombinase XerD
MSQVTPERLAGATTAVGPSILDLLPSFIHHLRAENKAPRTIQAYTEATRRLHDFLATAGMPTRVESIAREHVEAFIADQLERLKPASARSRYASLRQFFAWCEDEGEIGGSPMRKMHPPTVPEQPVPILYEEQLGALVRTTERDKSFFGLRDVAILRMFIDTGARLTEVSALAQEDLNLDSGTVRLLGKGRRVRYNPIGSKTIQAIDRYRRVRAKRPDAASAELWLGRQGPMTSYGVAEAMKRRAEQAGLGPLHVHQLRHSVAHHLRVAGVDDDSLLRLMGWRDRSMLHRYGASAADERAHAVHRKLHLADRL